MTHTEKVNEIAKLLNAHIEGVLTFDSQKRQENIYEFIEAIVKLWDLHDVSQRSELLKAISDLKDFAYEVCPLHREDDLHEIVNRL